MKEPDKLPEWFVFHDPQGDVSGIEDETGRMIVKFNPYDDPLFRAALARNLFLVRGTLRWDMWMNKYSFRTRWLKMLNRLRGQDKDKKSAASSG